MRDMLVRLYDLPDGAMLQQKLREQGIEVRRPLTAQKHVVSEWVRGNFSERWASECEASFFRQPVACFVAVADDDLCGFACYEVACRNFFGPVGVAEGFRGREIGTLLTLKSLQSLRDYGYAYAIIGGAGPCDFFRKRFAAMAIDGSERGIYNELLKE